MKVRALGKRYQIGESAGYRTLRETIVDAMRIPMRAARMVLRSNGIGDRTPKPTTIWALADANFDVARGEMLGVIGANGAGKSTLLKILSKVTEPTTGKVELFGRVGCLLEVGTGFHPELTGRENVYLSGAILGMHRRDIARRFDEIVSFAEIEKFIDTPVKRYSSGMYVRLAFAVAAHTAPEILLVDEVLAVGDSSFWQKSMDKMRELNTGGATILLVTHNLWFVQTMCSRAILLDHGSISAAGDPLSVIGKYHQGSGVHIPQADAPAAGTSQMSSFNLVPLGEWISPHVATPEAGLRLEFKARITGHSQVKCQVKVNSPDGFIYFSMNSRAIEVAPDGSLSGEVSIQRLMLKGGDYDLYLKVYSMREEPEFLAEACIPLTIEERDATNYPRASFWNSAEWKFHTS